MEQNKQSLATTTTITSNYGGQPSKKFYTQALLDSSTLKTQGLTVDNEISYQYVPRIIDMSGVVQTGSTSDGSFSASGTVTFSEQPIAVKEHRVNLQFKQSDFPKLDWDAYNAKNTSELPPDAQQAILDRTSAEIKKSIETTVWQGCLTGTTATTTQFPLAQFNGYIKQLKLAGAGIAVVGTTLSASNIIAEMNKVLAVVPDAFKNPDSIKDIVLFVSPTAYVLYKQAQAALTGFSPVGDKAADYMGYEVRAVGMDKAFMVMGKRENFHFASNADVDGQGGAAVDLKNMYPVNFDRNVRVSANWKYNVTITNKSQVVIYG